MIIAERPFFLLYNSLEPITILTPIYRCFLQVENTLSAASQGFAYDFIIDSRSAPNNLHTKKIKKSFKLLLTIIIARIF